MSPAGTNALSQASIPMWPVGSALLSVCVLKSLSGWLCLACYKQLPLLCPRDGWTLAWMLIGSLGFNSTFPTLFLSLLPFHLSQVGTEFTPSFVCLSSLFLIFFPFVQSRIFLMHLPSEYLTSMCFIVLHENLEQLFIETYICWPHVFESEC